MGDLPETRVIPGYLGGVSRVSRQNLAILFLKWAPKMGDLPETRVIPARPFLSVGIDFAGPILVKAGGNNELKRIYNWVQETIKDTEVRDFLLKAN
ncbi:hypothetical protein QE152_g21712 [Popillia japonica]|uniref:Uncharacterized protein n=1 Tax=Popillia japonica TaxID=7064 RepID=A0AAW1KNF4_POPJA